MNSILVELVGSASLWLALQATALLGIAALVQLIVYRRGSAATRHTVWTLAIASVLLLPLVSLALPQLPVVLVEVDPKPEFVAPVAMSAVAAEATPLQTSAIEPPPVPAGEATDFSWSAVVVRVYMVGLLVLLARLIVQRWTVRQFSHRATVVQDGDWMVLLGECADRMGVHRPVRLLRSREHNVPVTFGTRRPSIVIPAIADTWTEDRRRAVMCHELAHVSRFDCLTHTFATAACALYWFHPAVWWIARRLRIERELACDDRVIAVGTEPREYAGHLLEIAYSFGGRRAPALAVSMARPGQLEGRMLAALDNARNRTVPPFGTCLAGTAAALMLLVVIAAAKPMVAVAMPGETPDETQEEWPVAVEKPALASDVKSSAKDVKAAAKQLKEAARLSLRGLRDAGDGLARAVASAAKITQDGGPGTWEIRPTDAKGTVHLRLVERHSSSGRNVPIEQLEGLTASQLEGAGGPVQFSVRRDAGTFTFEGVVRNGVGAGTFAFSPDANFPAELAKRGFSRPTSSEQYQMARHDIGYAFLDELNKQGYARPQTADLVRAGQHGVHTTYLREMGALGYRLGSLDPLITLRDHGITPAYVRELADMGYKGLPADDLRQARDHGITPDYVRGMRDGGYGSLPMNELITARDHGVTPEFVRELGEAGHRKLPLDQLIRVRDHGVSPEYVREMRRLGYALAIDELVRARDHGVSLDYVRDMAALGYGSQPIDALIRVRDHGVTPQYARELKGLGYDKLTLDELVTLRDHGLTPDRIRAANARAGTRLPVDMLRSVAAGGHR
jgi:beta-lactamase regulating signal transducer with metallopeptidase domain